MEYAEPDQFGILAAAGGEVIGVVKSSGNGFASSGHVEDAAVV